jgi:hypothetical protein
MSARFVLTGFLVAATLGSAVAVDVPTAGPLARLNGRPDGARRKTFVSFSGGAIDLTGIDPTVQGATLVVFSPVTMQVATLPLPASGWRSIPSAPVPEFRFKSRTGPVTAARIIHGDLIRVSARGAEAYPLGQPQFTVAAQITFGSRKFCAEWGGTITRDDFTRFLARNAPPPASCLTPPAAP